ncbi:MAG: hypothetical protein L6Q26_02075 [Anaerolineales bacterium]|nr:hypothetical protein [Anaerolineales bacterium]NUQ86532.1 hypothetical protein [Anaerolineales bacterium]
MNHQPFEEWLLNETSLTPEQKRELDAHLRACAYCAALLETALVLRSAKMASPAEGFTDRFRVRLAERKLEDRSRRVWGGILFLIGGLGFLAWLASPSLLTFLSSPANWIAGIVEWGIYLITTLQAMSQAGEVFLRVLPGFIPPFAWMVIVSTFAGVGLLWSVSIWRFTRASQGV